MDSSIELRRLEKSYRGPRGPVRAVGGIDVSIARGETVALLGPNGAGKSSLVLAVAGVLKPLGGVVTMNGRDLAGRRPEKIRQAGLAVVPEGRRLLPDLTVEDNLRVATYSLSREDARASSSSTGRLLIDCAQKPTATT